MTHPDLDKLMKEYTSDKKPGCGDALGLLLLACALAIPLALFRGWIFWKLWGWFAVPLLPPLAWSAVVGMTFFVTAIFSAHTSLRDKTRSLGDYVTQIFTVQIALLLALFFGWILHLMGFGFSLPQSAFL